jgi:phosphate:Na+ symporter
MGKIANDNLALAMESFFERDKEKVKKVFENEEIVDYLNHEIASHLVWINNMSLNNMEAKRVGKMFRTLNDMERIGDHAENIAEYTMMMEEGDMKLSGEAVKELKVLSEATLKLATEALIVFENRNSSKLPKIKELEERVDQFSRDFAESHIDRMIAGSCDPKAGVIFTDMITDLERSGDHSNNIASSIRSNR